MANTPAATRRSVEDIIDFVREHGVVSVQDTATWLSISTATARRKLDAAVFRGELIRDEYSAEGAPLGHLDWRYCAVS